VPILLVGVTVAAGAVAIVVGAVVTTRALGKLTNWLDGDPQGFRPLRHDLPDGAGRGSYDTEPLPDETPQPPPAAGPPPAPAPNPTPDTKPAPTPAPGPALKPKPKDDDKRKRREVLFGQARIDSTFSNKKEVPRTLAGKDLRDVRDMLVQGKLSPNDIQIEVFRHGEVLVALNNRGLAVLSMANRKPTNLKLRSPTLEQRRRLLERPLVGGVLPSRSIAVTEDIKSKKIKYQVEIPGP
jgi:hypothetical protein